MIKKNGSPDHINALNSKIALITFEMKEAVHRELDRREIAAVRRIKENPKLFYNFAKSHSTKKTDLAMLFSEDSNVVTDKAQISNILQRQFSSVYSNPFSPDIRMCDFNVPNIASEMREDQLCITDQDIMAAIGDIKRSSAAGPDGIPAVLLKECAQSLVTPIRLLWQLSLKKGIIPNFYKKSHVHPLFKKGDRARAENYRPVSMTSHIIKVCERVLRKIMVNYLENNKILSHNQHGFRSGRSTLTQLLAHCDDICDGLRNDLDTDSIYLDYSKAFDKVDHNLLLSKLQKYKFHPMLIKWLKSFLTDRSQEVVVGGCHSLSAAIVSGVPQGTVLGPVLFIIFINDLDQQIINSNIRFFADDTRISKHIMYQSQSQELQQDLNTVVKWSKDNNMELHPKKFELIVHCAKPKQLVHELPFSSQLYSYQVENNIELFPVDVLRDLGMTMSSDGTWSEHIHGMVNKAMSVASWALSVFASRDKMVMLTLFKSMVRSHLEYCCPLWHPYKIGDIQKIENVQRSFTRRINGMSTYSYWDRLRVLGMMSLQRRRERYILIHTWKILNKLVPNDVKLKFKPSSRLGVQAIVPNINRSSRQANQTIYEHSFAVVAPKLWNTLPCELSVIQKHDSFKFKLTKYLQNLCDEPPVRGYQGRHHNTLPEVMMMSRSRRGLQIGNSLEAGAGSHRE